MTIEQEPQIKSDSFSVAVFCREPAFATSGRAEIVLIHLEAEGAETAATDAAARGYVSLAGWFAVAAGAPRVHCEAGFEATMVWAGAAFAEMLGPWLKEQQLQNSTAR